MRMQFTPLPAIMPLKPSSLQILPRAFGMLILYSVRPLDCTCSKILRRSSGDTTVRDTAPATPPATKEATTACDTHDRKPWSWTSVGSAEDSTMLYGFGKPSAGNYPMLLMVMRRLCSW